jgi:hypothetical protein
MGIPAGGISSWIVGVLLFLAVGCADTLRGYSNASFVDP